MNSYYSSFDDEPRNRRGSDGRPPNDGAYTSDPPNGRASSASRRRAPRKRTRAVGATSIAAPRAQSIGLPNPAKRRNYGRGETARRLEQDRLDAEQRNDIHARPAVYTGDSGGLLSRLRLPAIDLSSVRVVAIVLAVAVVAFMLLAGPVRNFYTAWRDAGVLQVQYEVLTEQNSELTHRLERLQTLEGIEDEARMRGYTYPGEEALVVDGLEDEQSVSPSEAEEAVWAHEDEQPWYVHVLDFIFGYRVVL